MNGADLLKGLSHIDESHIDQAQTQTFPRKTWLKAAALAACLVFAVLLSWRPEQLIGDAAPECLTFLAGGAKDPAGMPEQALPSVIVCVQTITEEGWIGTVIDPADSGIFEISMELKVVLTDTALPEDGIRRGSCILVEFTEYDPETNTIAAIGIREVPLPEETERKG